MTAHNFSLSLMLIIQMVQTKLKIPRSSSSSSSSSRSHFNHYIPPWGNDDAYDPFTESKAMEAPREQNKNRKTSSRHYAAKISFSASLPDDVQGAYADSICAVKHSMDPFEDLRESILEMIEDVGVHSWEEMEELVYCYVALNSSEIHGFIVDAFLSLCCT